MAKIKTVKGNCKIHCAEGFTIFKSKEEIIKLTAKFPFLEVIKFDEAVVGKVKRSYCVLRCCCLDSNGSCLATPEKSLAWCQVED